jgi:phospholipase C
MPRQEPGLRPSRALPYELAVTAARDAKGRGIVLRLEARNERFGAAAAGAPFAVYARDGEFACRHYAVEAGAAVEDAWPTGEGGRYHLCADGPNGFFREFVGDDADPAVSVEMLPPPAGGPAAAVQVRVRAASNLPAHQALLVRDHAYGNAEQTVRVGPGETATINVPVRSSHGWYDFSVLLKEGTRFQRRFAGRAETGADGFSDPQLSGPPATRDGR